MSSKTLDVSQEGKNLRLHIRAGDVTIWRLPQAFYMPYFKTWIGLDEELDL